MQANAVSTAQREQKEQARVRALVRFNATTFHSLAIASFLETAAPLQCARVALKFRSFPDAALWLEQGWCGQRAVLGLRLREYIQATWPEFDWSTACQEFEARYRPRAALEGVDRSAVREALALSVAAAQAAMFYRALARSADDPCLRELAREAAACHAVSFDSFRALFERCKRSERVGFAATWRTVGDVCRSAREHAVAQAFQPLAANWSGAPVLPAMSYSEFQARAAQMIQRHAAPGRVARLLFRPWLERSDPEQQAPAGRANWPSIAAQPG